MATAEALIRAEEFGGMSGEGTPTELLEGRVVELPPPNRRHGQVCANVAILIGVAARERDSGHVVINDTGIITKRDPDTVRGMDIAFFSYARLPRGPLPDSYGDIPPEIVFEVKSPSDRWPDIHAKVAEYLGVGVGVVCVLAPEPMAAHLHYPDQQPRTLGPDDELTFPECLGDFRVVVRRLFE